MCPVQVGVAGRRESDGALAEGVTLRRRKRSFPSVRPSSTGCGFHRKRRRGIHSLVGSSTTCRIQLSARSFRACEQERPFRVFARLSLAVGMGLLVFVHHQSHVMHGSKGDQTAGLYLRGVASLPLLSARGRRMVVTALSEPLTA